MTRISPTWLSLFYPAVALAVGCSGTVEPADGGNNTDDPLLGAPGDGTGGGDGTGASSQAWTLIQPCTASGPYDAIQVDDVELKDGLVEVTASHSAGCAEHSYGLCYENAWAESDPVQIGLRLMHDSHGESCEALATVELAFDLGPLESAYEDAYQSDGGVIDLSLGQFSFTYRFGSTTPDWEVLDALVEEYNSCEVVSDCVPIATRACDSAYVNKDADTTDLESMIQARNEADYGEGPIACTDDCPCGVLSCSDGKCTTTAGGCMDVGADEQNICL